MDSPTPDAAPAALADLIAAGLVSHELIGDPAQLGAEAPALAALCGLIAGSVYRIEPFHYAFRAEPDDLAGQLAALPAEDWAGAMERALKAALGLGAGSDAIWLGATEPDLAESGPADGAAAETARFEAPLLLLRAQAAAVEAGIETARIETADPGLQAVIQARYAAETARLTARSLADAEPGTALARRLAAIELRQEEILARLAEAAPVLGPDPLLVRLNAGLADILDRLERHEARAGDMAEHLAEHLTLHLSGLLTGLLAERPVPSAFQETIGLTLAEFLAQLERRDLEGRAPRPRLS